MLHDILYNKDVATCCMAHYTLFRTISCYLIVILFYSLLVVNLIYMFNTPRRVLYCVILILFYIVLLSVLVSLSLLIVWFAIIVCSYCSKQMSLA